MKTSALIAATILPPLLGFFPMLSSAQQAGSNANFYSWAPTPPMGWNSYDCLGTSITEAETLANAQYMKEHLLSHGWKYVVIDARWYDTVSSYDDRDFNKERAGAKLAADQYGRLLPSINRFPSAADGKGFKPLADKIHAMGLRFGFHMMRGIPKQNVTAKSPIEGSTFTADAAANQRSLCSWCPDMFGVNANAAGQAWYDSCAKLWASWGLDFVKVDDLSSPYHQEEIEMIRKALDKCGRPIVFSTSAGPTKPEKADHISTHANMWRVSGDFWDRWPDLDRAFDLLGHWQGVARPGAFPDADMIPFGHIGIKCTIAGKERQTRFTKDEQRLLFTLWSIAPSPLILGNNLPDTDEWTLSMLTNDEVLAVNQDPLGLPAKRTILKPGIEVWVKNLKDHSVAIGVFNRTGTAEQVDLNWNAIELKGKQQLRDLWAKKNLGVFDSAFTTPVPSHGAVLVRGSSIR